MPDANRRPMPALLSTDDPHLAALFSAWAPPSGPLDPGPPPAPLDAAGALPILALALSNLLDATMPSALPAAGAVVAGLHTLVDARIAGHAALDLVRALPRPPAHEGPRP